VAKRHPLDGIEIFFPAGKVQEVLDPDDPNFTVSYALAVGVQEAGPWRPNEQAMACLPTIFYAEHSMPNGSLVELEFRVEKDGQVVCYRLTVDARDDDRERAEVSLAGIRNLRIGELKRRATRLALVEVYLRDDGTATFRSPSAADEETIKASAPDVLAKLEKNVHQPQRGKRLSDAHLREVAKVYREALKADKPKPTKAVMQHFFTARANAGRWVAEARERGFLGKAEAPRQAGERRPKGGKIRGKG
jgi:hypothetical protein